MRLFEFRANNPLTNKNYISSLINALLDAILHVTVPCAARLLFSFSVLAEAWLDTNLALALGKHRERR